MNELCASLIGVQRTWTLRNHARPVGPQYSSELGKASGSVNGLQYWPAPKVPTSPHAWRRRKVVWPASTPVPNSSNSKIVFRSPNAVGVEDLTPNRVCRTPANTFPPGLNSPLNDGNWVGRSTSNQFGFSCLKSYPESSITKP